MQEDGWADRSAYLRLLSGNRIKWLVQLFVSYTYLTYCVPPALPSTFSHLFIGLFVPCSSNASDTFLASHSELVSYVFQDPETLGTSVTLLSSCSFGVVFEGQKRDTLELSVRGQTRRYTRLQVLDFDSG